MRDFYLIVKPLNGPKDVLVYNVDEMEEIYGPEAMERLRKGEVITDAFGSKIVDAYTLGAARLDLE